MKWVQCGSGDFAGDPPSLRSGHSAVRVKGNRVVVFGGLYDKCFLHDLHVLDIENKLWFQPECTGTAEEGVLVGPSPRAFHVAVAVDCNMFIFGGRYGRKRLGDFWMLDTETWQWVELSGYGDLPPARDFAAGASVGNGKLVIYGGWDGTKWLSDIYVLNTMSLEWVLLPIAGPAPAPRCGHSATMVEKRMLIFGGRGGGGPIMGDLWALKGLFDEGRTRATSLDAVEASWIWTCTSLWPFYHRRWISATVQWKRLSVSNEPPPARAYHTVTRIGPRFLLIGGYDGKSTFGDMWWLVNEEDEIAKRALLSPASSLKTADLDTFKAPPGHTPLVNLKTQGEVAPSPLHELRQRLGLPAVTIPAASASPAADEELLALGKELLSDRDQSSPTSGSSLLKVVREHWSQSDPHSIRIRELPPLLRDYRRLVAARRSELLKFGTIDGAGSALQTYRFYHLLDANQVRMDDVPGLLTEYKQLCHLQIASDQAA